MNIEIYLFVFYSKCLQKYYKNKKIIMLLVIAIALPLIIVTVYSNNTSKNNFDVMYNATTKDNLDRTSEVINSLYKSNVESINMLSEDPNAKSVLNSPICEPWLVKSLEGFLVSHKDITSVYLGLSNGKTLLHQLLNSQLDMTQE